jgi:hypothetical protein
LNLSLQIGDRSGDRLGQGIKLGCALIILNMPVYVRALSDRWNDVDALPRFLSRHLHGQYAHLRERPVERRGANFKAFVKDNFLPWIETNRSAQTYQSYDWRCDVLIKEFGKLDLFEISDFAIEKFKREEMKRKTRLGETQSPASVNRFLQILGSIFTRAEEAKLITEKQRPKITLVKEGNE